MVVLLLLDILLVVLVLDRWLLYSMSWRGLARRLVSLVCVLVLVWVWLRCGLRNESDGKSH